MTERYALHKALLFSVATAITSAALMSPVVFADATVTVKVTVVSEPCIINGDNPIDVDFGNDLLTSRVDGVHYMKPVNYTLDCSNATRPALKMRITGTAAGFDSNVLQVAEQASMGVKLLSNGTMLPLNSWLNFTKDSPPVLQAVPVKAAGSTLTAGAFSAAATMTVDYQ